MDHLILARRLDQSTTKKENLQIFNFAVPADHRIKLKGYENKDNYVDLARELKKIWNMKVSFIPIVIGAFGTVTKGRLKGLGDYRLENEWRPSKLQHYWEWSEYWEESCRLEDTCCHSSEKPSAKSDVKNSQWVNNDNNKKNECIIDIKLYKEMNDCADDEYMCRNKQFGQEMFTLYMILKIEICRMCKIRTKSIAGVNAHLVLAQNWLEIIKRKFR